MSRKFRRGMAAVLCLLLILLLAGCTGQSGKQNELDEQGITVSTADAAESLAPMVQPDGEKLRIGLLDIDEYEPASTYLYYVLQGLKDAGWITFDSLPFTATSMDVKAMMQELSKMDLGPYIEFVGDAAYYLAYESEDSIEQSMLAQINSAKGLDLVLAMGTDPGLFMKKYSVPVNTLVCMATDPVASGIIESSEHSGNDRIWAQVEPLPYYRQIKFYHNIIPFDNIGMVYTDEVVAGIPDYQNGADELGVTITKVQIEDQAKQTEEEQEQFSQMLLKIYQKMIDEDKIDAYLLSASLISSGMDLKPLIQPFLDKGIPVFVQDGENYVREGALLLVASTDNQGVGQFVAEVIAKVAHGQKPGDIDCEYVSSPYMSINLDTAKAIGFRPSFEMLLSCETIYSTGGASAQ